MRGDRVLRRWRNGLSPASQLAYRTGRTRRAPKFAGVALTGPDPATVWGLCHEIALGEYAHSGLEPRPGDRVIDIGANVGVYALWAARRGAVVTAYEPAPATFEHLLQNTKDRSIRSVQAAVVGTTPSSGTVTLFLHHERSSRNSLLAHEIGSGEPHTGAKVDVKARSINDVLAEGCDLLKIDCEGGEFELFDSVTDESLARVGRVVLEFHRTAGDPDRLARRLEQAGFSVEIVAGEAPEAEFGLLGATRAPAAGLAAPGATGRRPRA